VLEVLPSWIAFPRQIESGLRAHFHGANIGQWHRGEMSSRELLVLLDGMPEESEYKRALDGYPYGVERDWTKGEYRQARMVAEAAVANRSLDLDELVGPIESAIAAMRKRNDWPPAWWSDDVRAKVIKAEADARLSDEAAAARSAMPDEQFDAATSAIENQLFGRT
jgi:hypothetical protein